MVVKKHAHRARNEIDHKKEGPPNGWISVVDLWKTDKITRESVVKVTF